MKQKLREVRPHAVLYRDDRTGIAWVEDGSTGMGHSAHPNIDASGSVRGMKSLGYWAKDARTVRSHGFIYNIDALVVEDELDEYARSYCRCGGRHEKKRNVETFAFTVTVDVPAGDRASSMAERVMMERIDFDEDYGFEYQIGWNDK